jgi:NAD-dependent DNA ligase
MRARAYQKAQQSLMLYDKPITDVKQISDLKGIGKTILAKFQEFVDTGKLQAIEKEKSNPIYLFTNIYGVGPKKAQDLIKKDITTIVQLRENQGELNDKQKLGLQYYEDIEERIPRVEIQDYEKVLEKIFKGLKFTGASMQIVGSYRRGAKNSGDIDIIMTDKQDNPDLLSRFVGKLVEDGIVLHKLTDGKTKVLAIAKLPGKQTARRVDFLYTPLKEYAFAILYFTGSKVFNTVMRQRALNMGYTLNEHGIYKMVSGKKGARVDQEFPDEKSIFDFLNMEYKTPEERKDARAVKDLGSVHVGDTPSALPEPAAPVTESAAPEPAAPVTEPALPAKKAIVSVKRTVKKKAVLPTTLMKDFVKKGISFLGTLSEKQLEDVLTKANDLYYNQPEKVILSDEQFDIIKEYFEKKYPTNPLLKIVGAPIIGKKDKVVLPFPMPSMDKIKPESGALPKWLAKYNKPKSYLLSAKLDGTSGLYTTTGGVAKLYTRGDGLIGKDITHLIPYLRLPDVKTHPDMVLRGEFVISKDNFAKHFKEKGSKNARNTVAGLTNTLVGTGDHKYIDFVGYEVMVPEMTPEKQMETMEKTLKMDTVKNRLVKELSNDMLSRVLVDWRANYKYEIDGIIVAHNKIYSDRKNKNPEHAFAFKMVLSDQVAEAKVVNVLWSPSKDGYLKPRVQIEPIELGGVTITYATGKNAAFIEKHKIGVGSIVELVRSGDVIPDIKKVVVPASEPLMPDVPYVWNETHVDIMLTDKSANATVREKNILGFFKILEVDGVGPGVVKKMMTAGYDSVSAILRMTEDDFLGLDGFKKTMAHKIYTNIQKGVKDASLPLLMKASNIFGRGFGERKITPMLEEYPNILVSKDSDATKIAKITGVSGWSTKTATEFVKHIGAFVAFLKECGLEDRASGKSVKKATKSVDESHPLFGKRIVITGFRPKELMTQIESMGGVLGSSVSKKTFAVIVKDLDEDTGKAGQARELGIPIMTPDSFKQKYALQ